MAHVRRSTAILTWLTALLLMGCQQGKTAQTGADAPAPVAPDVLASLVHQMASGLGADAEVTELTTPDSLTEAWEDLTARTLTSGDGWAAATVTPAVGTLDATCLVAAGSAESAAAAVEGLTAGEEFAFAVIPAASGAGVALAVGPECQEAVARVRRMTPVVFPAAIGEWTLGEQTTFDDKTIFDYIDGAADRHLRFGYEDMQQARYVRGEEKVVADVYRLRCGADAYGLFTNLAKGTASDLGQLSVDNKRALYLWQGCYYVEVKPGSRGGDPAAALREVAEAVVAALGPDAALPDMVRKLGPITADFAQVRYFHEAIDQQNWFYLSTANVLQLGKETAGLLVKRGEKMRPEVLLVVRYASDEAREAALGETIAAAVKQGVSYERGVPCEWDTGRFLFVPLADALPGHTLVAAFDSTSADAARALAEEAAACLR